MKTIHRLSDEDFAWVTDAAVTDLLYRPAQHAASSLGAPLTLQTTFPQRTASASRHVCFL